METTTPKFSLAPVFLSLAIVSPLVVMFSMSSMADPSQARQASQGAIGILFWASCLGAYFTRRKPIGGYLFIFFFQLVVAAVVVIGMAGAKFLTSSGHLNSQSTVLSVLLILGNLPFYLATFVTIVFAFLAFARRDARHLKTLRRGYVALLITSALGVFIDLINFPNAIPLSIGALIWTTIWCAYVFLSHRVEWVLGRSEWDLHKFSVRPKVVARDKLSKTLPPAQHSQAADAATIEGSQKNAITADHWHINARQRWALASIGCFAIAVIMFPPFVINLPNGMVINGGFSFLFSTNNSLALVNTGLLGLELLVVSILGIVGWLIARD